MKKKFCTVVALVVAVLLSFNMMAVNTTGITVANGMLIFDTKETYTNLVANSSADDQNEFIVFSLAQTNFNSLLETKETNAALYNEFDDFFASIINDKGYVQIGSYIYKVNVPNEQVFVFPSSHTELIAAIDVNNMESPLILKYSAQDYVIGMVESNTPPSQSRLFCGETGAGGDRDEGTVDLYIPGGGGNCNADMYGIVRFISAGIHFKLYAQSTNKCAARRMYYHKTPVAYKVKCGYTYGPVYQWDIDSGYNGGPSNVWNATYYQNVQPLNAYHLRIVFMAKDPNWIGNPDNSSLDLEIRRNM